MTVQHIKAESEFFKDVTGFILLGGKSSRYGSNKAFVVIDGVRLVDRVARVMKSIFHRVVLLTNTPEEYAYLEMPMVEDLIKGLGPMGGIYTGLMTLSDEAGFFVACDMPFLSESLIRHMVDVRHDFDVVVPRVGWMLEPKGDQIAASSFTTNLTIRQIASKIDTTGFALAKELALPRSVDKDTPLAELGVEQSQLDEVTTHLLSHRGRGFKYYVFAALSLFGLVWLVRLGRPDGSPNSERKTWYPRAPYIMVLSLAVVICGFALGKSACLGRNVSEFHAGRNPSPWTVY